MIASNKNAPPSAGAHPGTREVPILALESLMTSAAPAAPLIEKHTIGYVPPEDRHGKVKDLFTLWFGGNIAPLPHAAVRVAGGPRQCLPPPPTWHRARHRTLRLTRSHRACLAGASTEDYGSNPSTMMTSAMAAPCRYWQAS